MASTTNRLRVRPDPVAGVVWIDTKESIPAGYGHQLDAATAARMVHELAASVRVLREAQRAKHGGVCLDA